MERVAVPVAVRQPAETPNTRRKLTMTTPDNPADPEAAALELIVRLR
jgi:hypothetical protein